MENGLTWKVSLRCMLPATSTASNGESLQKKSAKRIQSKFNIRVIPVINISYTVKSAVAYLLIFHTFITKRIYLMKKWSIGDSRNFPILFVYLGSTLLT